ncbi:hypothetical protein TIFTF001_017013 [Ficus carica]|uniref:Uncharacterized protein n=1 Tax=Ficus carica TaxID=3494 RepID=A0AA88A456_FICCA|nr:hypothetical protein TIFTF001_017013 [Ficus carica]
MIRAIPSIAISQLVISRVRGEVIARHSGNFEDRDVVDNFTRLFRSTRREKERKEKR